MSDTQKEFFALVGAGLWETDVCLTSYETSDADALLQLAQEQSVVGLVAAGIAHIKNVKIPKADALQYIGQTLQIEQRNSAMNTFISGLMQKLLNAGIYTLLVKGQGIAQCYERPLWRSSGDVDLFLDDESYENAKKLLIPLASNVEPESAFKKHLGLTIDGWLVELHGRLRNGLSSKMDKALDAIQKDTFFCGNVRTCLIGDTQVFMLGIENDIIYVFSHILDHFYKGGIGLRQVCDWCRLIFCNHDNIDLQLLEQRINQMGVMSEWKAFGAFAVDGLGMPSETMPFYSPDAKWSKKAEMIKDFIMEVGNFGHNRDNSYYATKPFVIKKAISFGRRLKDLYHHARIFPMDSIRFFWGITVYGVKATMGRDTKKTEIKEYE